jgi:asparagine synthase (glutamine-hydrolysing)
MCGISGIWYSKHDIQVKTVIIAFNQALQHRGPDGEGYFQDEHLNLALGHVRLSILDISERGRQPMISRDGRYVLTFNGEVFNFLELRSELKYRGYSFISDTDSEVVLYAFQEWGISAFSKFNGMWALAIWDTLSQELLLCRDRFGIKPLFFLDHPQMFAFASETIAFKHLDGFTRSTYLPFVAAQLQDYSFLEAKGLSLFKDIYQVPAGHWLKVDRTLIKTSGRWWRTQDNLPQIPKTFPEQADTFRQLFRDSCLLRLRTDVPLATALSGGLDSSSVYSMLQCLNPNEVKRSSDNRQHAYCAVFPNTSLDEWDYARQLVEHFHGELHRVDALDSGDLIGDLTRSVALFDNFYITPIHVITRVYQAMSKAGCKVSMDGHGVDEMLFGYNADMHQLLDLARTRGHSRYEMDVEETLLRLYPPDERASLSKGIAEQKALKIPFYDLKNYLKHRKSILFGTDPSKLSIRDPWLNSDFDTVTLRNPWFVEERPIEDPYLRLMYHQFHNGVLPTILRNFDRASMQVGVEVRMPFMDYRLVSYVMALPQQSKVSGGFNKRILREALIGILPTEIRTRTFKMSIQAPMQSWLAGPLNEWALDQFHSSSFQQGAIWKSAPILNEMKNSKNLSFAQASKLWHYLNAYLLLEHS